MKTFMRYFLWLSVFLVLTTFSPFPIQAQSPLKKIRMSLPSKNVAYLAIYLARDKGLYKQEGIDLELILMPANLASTAVLTGNLDYNGAPTGVIGAAVQDRPMKVLIFTVARPPRVPVPFTSVSDPALPPNWSRSTGPPAVSSN